MLLFSSAAVHTASTPNVTPAPSVSDVQTALELEEGEKKDLDVSWDPNTESLISYIMYTQFYVLHSCIWEC